MRNTIMRRKKNIKQEDSRGPFHKAGLVKTLRLLTLKWGKLWVFRFTKGGNSNCAIATHPGPATDAGGGGGCAMLGIKQLHSQIALIFINSTV